MAESDIAPFRRLMGFETEYALRIPAGLKHTIFGTHRDGFEALTAELRSRMPTADADVNQSGKVGLFLSTGGAVWFERRMPASQIGLVEGATPECLSPRDLLACQRAQDRLLSEAANSLGYALVKNCRDAHGNIYGAQENYEVVFASGLSLWSWRIAMWVLLLPLSILITVALIPIAVIFLMSVGVGIYIYRLTSRKKSQAERIKAYDFWVGRTSRIGWDRWDGVELPCGTWTDQPMMWISRILISPTVVVIWTFRAMLQFRPVTA